METPTVLELVIAVWQTPIPVVEPKILPIITRPPRCLEGEGLRDDYYCTLFTPAEDPTLLSLYLDHVEGCSICHAREYGGRE